MYKDWQVTSAWRSKRSQAAGPMQTWGTTVNTNTKRHHYTFRSSSPSRGQSWANHKGFQKKSKSMPRKRKSGQHLINLLASSQGRSLQRGTSHGETPSPRHIYGNMAVNPGRGCGREKPILFTMDSCKRRGSLYNHLCVCYWGLSQLILELPLSKAILPISSSLLWNEDEQHPVF